MVKIGLIIDDHHSDLMAREELIKEIREGRPILVKKGLMIFMESVEFNIGSGDGRYLSQLYVGADEATACSGLTIISLLGYKLQQLWKNASEALGGFQAFKEGRN